MKKDGKYRYSLQFSNEPERNYQVGEFLEQLGNRKSAVIVTAVYEYMQTHPIQAKSSKIKVQIDTPIHKEKLEKMIREIVEEVISQKKEIHPTDELSVTESDIDQMLGNLDLFSL